MFPLGGHIGPPLRRLARISKNCPTVFVISIPLVGRKTGVSYGNTEESLCALC